MKTAKIENLLTSNAYPGRGIIIGRSADGKTAVTAYFIMGRSVNSRNRVFTETADGIKTEAADPAKLSDPHLIIYSPVRVLGNKTIVTNGDQTDTIYELMDKQYTFEQALRTRVYEDDAPNFTPRISGIMHIDNGTYNYAMNIIKSADGDPDCVERFTYSYNKPLAGVPDLDTAKKFLDFIDALEDDEDVQHVYHNADISDAGSTQSGNSFLHLRGAVTAMEKAKSFV